MEGQAELTEFYRTNTEFQRRVQESPNVELDNGEEFEDDLSQLNKQFLDTCVQSLKDVGRDSSLAPVVIDYLRYTIELLGGAAVRDGEPAEFFLELGTSLHELVESYYTVFFKMEQQQKDGTGNKESDQLARPGMVPSMDFETSPAPEFPINGLPDRKANPLLALQAIGYQKLTMSKNKESVPPPSAVIPKFDMKSFEPVSPNSVVKPPVTSNGNIFGSDTSSWASPNTTMNSSPTTPGSSPVNTSIFSRPGYFDPPPPVSTSSVGISSVLPVGTTTTLTKDLASGDFQGKSSSSYQNVPGSFSFKTSESDFRSGTSPMFKPSMSEGFGVKSSAQAQLPASSFNPAAFAGDSKSSSEPAPSNFLFKTQEPLGLGDVKKSPQSVPPFSFKSAESEVNVKQNPFTIPSGRRSIPFSATEPIASQTTITESAQPFTFNSKDTAFTSAKPPSSTSTRYSFKPVESSATKESDTPLSASTGFSFKSVDTPTTKGETTSSFSPPVTSNGSIFGNSGAFPGTMPSFNTSGPGLFSGLAGNSGTNIFSSTTPSTSSAAASEKPKTEEPDEDEKKEKEAQSHEFTPIVEEDALYSIKSKIFEWDSKTSTYVVRGVGMLHIRQLDDGNYQLIVRADNALGNVLLNMKLASEIPIVIEKNNLKMFDPHKSPPQRILIRVRLATDAQLLLDKIKEYIATANS